MDTSITNTDLRIIQDKLNININDSFKLLTDIIKINHHNNLQDIFFKYFYVSYEKLEDAERNFYHSLLDNLQFKVIHANSKNGKTTLIYHILYENKTPRVNPTLETQSIFPVHFDFEKTPLGSFITKVKTFYEMYFISSVQDERIKIDESVESFCSFLVQFIENLKKANLVSQASFLENSVYHIVELFDAYFAKTKLGTSPRHTEVFKLFGSSISDKINQENCGDFFIFLILFILFSKKDEILINSKSKIAFILDNIDEYLEHEDFMFLQYPQIHLSAFIYQMSQPPLVSNVFTKTLSKYCSTKFENPYFDFQSQIKIVYVFRTANFLVFANLLEKQRDKLPLAEERHIADVLFEDNFIDFKTEGNTSEIFKLRLQRYEEICTKLHIPITPGYYFLKKLADNFDSNESNAEKRDVRRIYNIWNGDKVAFWDSIIKNWRKVKENYICHEKLLQCYPEGKTNKERIGYAYLLRGTYVNFFLFLLRENSNLKRLLYNAIFAFMDPKEGKQKNIRRVIINCIINESINKGSATKIHDISNKGVGFYDLLDQINGYIIKVNGKRAENELLYSFSQVEEYFEEICKTKIDHFANLFNIYKDQIVVDSKSNEVLSNYYNLKDEIQRFRNEGVDCKEELNKIRLYHNESAPYISYSLLTNFELYSFSTSNGHLPTPLLFLLTKKNNLNVVSNENQFSFYDIIEKVYKNVERIIDNMVEFYLENLIQHFPPEEFIINPYFTVLLPGRPEEFDSEQTLSNRKGDFQFRLIISRHRTYLENFRHLIVNDCNELLKLSHDEKVIANVYISRMLLKYCRLYFKNYEKIKAVYPIDNTSLLTATYNKFKEFEEKYIDTSENVQSNFDWID